MRQQVMIVILIMIVLIYFTFPRQDDPIYVNQQPVEVEPFAVHVQGAVNIPNTYYFFEPQTVYAIIERAGGLSEDADETQIDYRMMVEETMTLTIPSQAGDEEPIVQTINVNEASFSELIEVPYVSETMAAYIIMYREEHGDFQSLDDLILVKYIGAATLEKIKPYLSIS